MMMEILHPPGWPRPTGYAYGIQSHGPGRSIHVSGCIGWDSAQQIISTDFVAQAAQALRNIVSVLQSAAAQPQHLVRLTWYITDRAAYLAQAKALGAAYRSIIGKHYPAMSVVVVAGLLEPGALVEIEAQAFVPD